MAYIQSLCTMPRDVPRTLAHLLAANSLRDTKASKRAKSSTIKMMKHSIN
jgi:hypothetical protein